MAKARCNRCGGSAISDTFEKARSQINHAVGLSRGINCGDAYGAVQEEINTVSLQKTITTPSPEIKEEPKIIETTPTEIKEEPKIIETIQQEKVEEPKLEKTKTTGRKSKNKKF